MKIEHFTYTPPEADPWAEPVAIGYSIQEKCGQIRVSLFMLAENGGPAVTNYIPELMVALHKEQQLGDPIADIAWTITAGNVTSSRLKIDTIHGIPYRFHVDPEFFTMEAMFRNNHPKSCDFLFTIEKYRTIHAGKGHVEINLRDGNYSVFILPCNVHSLSGRFFPCAAERGSNHVILADSQHFLTAMTSDFGGQDSEVTRTPFSDLFLRSSVKCPLRTGFYKYDGESGVIEPLGGHAMGLAEILNGLSIPFVPITLPHDLPDEELDAAKQAIGFGYTPGGLGPTI